jgi:dienelactone hydrolase
MTIMRRCQIVFAVSLVVPRLDGQSIRVTPRAALMDDVVRIEATGLKPDAVATIRARRTDGQGRTWESVVEVRANAKGVIDLANQAPTSGSYSGRLPMGVLTSMDVVGTGKGTSRATQTWSDTLRTTIELEIGGRVLSSDTLTQRFIEAGVRVQSVRDSGLVATLFTPPSANSPGLLVLGGSEGGLSSEDVAALLASRGYTAVALAYFGAEGLPASLDEIPVEYFERAIRLLERGSSGAIGIVGTSKGAEAALVIASRNPDVKTVVAYAPSNVVWSCICADGTHASWSEAGASLPFVPPGTNPNYHPSSGGPIRPTENYTYRLRDSSVAARAEIPVERIRGPILLVAGGEDGLWPSLRMANGVLARRRRLGGFPADAVLAYAGAGHLIGKAYLPAGSTVVGGGRLETGGTPEANAAAQADSWPRVLAFLRATLPLSR